MMGQLLARLSGLTRIVRQAGKPDRHDHVVWKGRAGYSLIHAAARPEHPGDFIYYKTWDIEGSLARPPE
jgi:hypothetical protein